MRCKECGREVGILFNSLCYECNKKNQNRGNYNTSISKKEKPENDRGWYNPKKSPGGKF